MSGHFNLTTMRPQMGCWEIYHVPMNPNIGRFKADNPYPNFFKVFVDLGLVGMNEQPYNILLQNEIDYNIYLPPIESISNGSRYSLRPKLAKV
jgi:hypothetical protein